MKTTIVDEIKKYPILRLVLAFICGIICAIEIGVPSRVALLSFFVSVVLFMVLKWTLKRYYGVLIGIAIHCVFIAAGMYLTSVRQETATQNLKDIRQGFIIGEICDDPKESGKNTVLRIDVVAVKNDDRWQSSEGRTQLYLTTDENTKQLRVGDKIIFSPHLTEIENKGNPNEFDYKKYLAYNLILSSDFLAGDDWQLLRSDGDMKLRYRLLRFRGKLIQKLTDLGLTSDELAVVSALALGYKDNLSDEIQHNYSSSGAMHILAVSGLHVGIIYGIIIALLGFIRSKRLQWLKMTITIVLIWLYAMLAGLSPSVCRSALMFSIIGLATMTKASSSSLNTVAASAFILLLINPYNITNIGFQLSYIAVIGIIVVQPKLNDLLNIKNKLLNKIWSLTTVSVAAQLVTAPICIYYFHQFSNYFLITNYLLIPTATVAIWLVIGVFIFSGWGLVATFLTKILSYVVKFMNMSTAWIESLPGSVSDNLYISLPQMFLLYAIIILLMLFFFRSKQYKHLFSAIAVIIVFMSFGLYYDYKNTMQKNIIIYNINKTTAINLIDGRDNIMFANLDSAKTERIAFTAKNNWLQKGLNKEKYINLSSGAANILRTITTIDNKSVFFKDKFIAFDDITLYVLDDGFNFYCRNFADFRKQHADIVVLSNSPKISLAEVGQLFDFGTIVIDSSNKKRQVEQWLAENEVTKFNVHNVKTEGAFVMN